MEESVLAPEATAVAMRNAQRPESGRVPSLHGLRSQARNLGQLLGSHVVVGVAGLASLPVLARNFGSEAYGRFSLFLLLLGALSNLDIARPILVRELSRGSAEGHRTPDEETATALAATSAWLLGGAALALGLLISSPLVAGVLAVAVFLHALTAAPFARLSAEGRVGVAGSIRNAYWALALVAIVAASFVTRSPHAWVWAFAGSNALILATYLRVSPIPVATFRLPHLPSIARFRVQAKDVFLFALASAVVASCDRLLLEANATASAFGHYAGQYDLAIKINVVSAAVCSVVYPSFSRLHADEGGDAASAQFVRLVSRVATLYFVGLAVLIVAHDQILELVFGSAFASGVDLDVYAFLLVGVFLHLFGFLITPYQRARGDFRTHRVAYMCSAGLMLVIGVLAIPRYGAAGAIATYLCARLAEVALIAIEVRRMPREVLPAWKVITLAGMVLTLAALAWLAFDGRLDAALPWRVRS